MQQVQAGQNCFKCPSVVLVPDNLRSVQQMQAMPENQVKILSPHVHVSQLSENRITEKKIS